MSKYTDAEMLMATQIAYLDFENGRGRGINVGERVNNILNTYGIYDSATGTYTLKEGISGEAQAQFNTAQNIMKLSEENNVYSWQQWNVVDVKNEQQDSGFYGCMIETGNGDSIVGFRGSESYDCYQAIKDWGKADVGRINNELTEQQADATDYMEYLYKKYGDSYEKFYFTGHSLGGSLATHAAISAPKGMQDKINTVISFDGPGFSDEYLKKNADYINRVQDKLIHYEYSWVGSLLYQPDGIKDIVIKAHDDDNAGKNSSRSTKMIYNFIERMTGIPNGTLEIMIAHLLPQLYRHATYNIEFDENGNTIIGEQGVLQKTLGPISKIFEISPSIAQILFVPGYLCLAVLSLLISIGDKLKQEFEQIVCQVKEKINDIYNAYVLLVVSGDYEINLSQICNAADDLSSVDNDLKRIAAQVEEIKRTLPYDSMNAFYYKNCLGNLANSLESEGKKAKKIASVIDNAVSKYNQADMNVAALF